MKRCGWVSSDDLYIKYHDEEWAKPVFDDTILFEFLLLESFQAGLSWITILKKHENFRKAFDYFDLKKISNYNKLLTFLVLHNSQLQTFLFLHRILNL